MRICLLGITLHNYKVGGGGRGGGGKEEETGRKAFFLMKISSNLSQSYSIDSYKFFTQSLVAQRIFFSLKIN